jgi:hypothetical protein
VERELQRSDAFCYKNEFTFLWKIWVFGISTRVQTVLLFRGDLVTPVGCVGLTIDLVVIHEKGRGRRRSLFHEIGLTTDGATFNAAPNL